MLTSEHYELITYIMMLYLFTADNLCGLREQSGHGIR